MSNQSYNSLRVLASWSLKYAFAVDHIIVHAGKLIRLFMRVLSASRLNMLNSCLGCSMEGLQYLRRKDCGLCANRKFVNVPQSLKWLVASLLGS